MKQRAERKRPVKFMSALFVTALGAVLFALCFPVEAQQPKRVPRIGYLAGAADRKSPPVEAFRQGLRDLGYVEGKKHSG